VLLFVISGANSVEQPEYPRVFVGHIRKKLESEEGAPRYIVTEPWIALSQAAAFDCCGLC